MLGTVTNREALTELPALRESSRLIGMHYMGRFRAATMSYTTGHISQIFLVRSTYRTS